MHQPNVIDMENNSYLLWFQFEDMATEMLSGRPWSLLGGILNVIPWRLDFQALQQSTKYAPVWVRLPRLPFEYWNMESIHVIASKIGKPLRVDEWAINLEHGKYVIICLEIDLKKPLQEGPWIGHPGFNFFQVCTYENLPTLCASCGCRGHSNHIVRWAWRATLWDHRRIRIPCTIFKILKGFS